MRTGVTVIVPSEADVGARAAVRRLPHAQRQRRADRARVGARVRPADDADRAHQHAQRRRRARRAGRPLGGASAARTTGSTGRCRWSARRGTGMLNDINGHHVRPEHVDEALAQGERRRGRGGRGRRRHRDDLPRLQGRDRHRLARDRRGARRLHGRRARAGQPRLARAADGGGRPGRPRDRHTTSCPTPTRTCPTPRRAPARSSSWWRPTRRCCRTSAGGSPSAPRSASRAPAAPASTRAATS